MKVSSSFPVRHDPEVIRSLVKDFFTTSLSFYVPHMSQAAQNEIFKDFPQLKGKNYAQIMGDHSPLDTLSDQQAYGLLKALQAEESLVKRAAGKFAERYEELRLVYQEDRFEPPNSLSGI